MEKARHTLASERYAHLLAAVEDLVNRPPLRRRADARSADVMPRLLARDLKRLGRAVDAIPDAATGTERDLAFHEARKKAKRLRYAAEVASPALGKPARTLARSSKRAQELLGEHQDSVTARARLRELAMQVHLAGGNGFTLGRLHALEQVRAERAEADFAEHWKHLRRKHFKRWTS
jgi:CHAD domain-containing protein